MFKKILLPVDLSNKHQQALETAADLAQQSGGEVVLLHVIEVIAGLPFEEERSFYQRLEKSARAQLARFGDQLKQRKAACRAEVVYGNRGAEILRLARTAGVDLTILTAPHLDPTNPSAGWGSLSYKISMFSECPVLLVK